MPTYRDFSATEVAGLLRTPLSTVYNWFASGAIPATYIGPGYKAKGVSEYKASYEQFYKAIGYVGLKQLVNLLLVEEVANWLRVGPGAVTQWIRYKSFPAIIMPHTEYTASNDYRVPRHWIEGYYQRPITSMLRLLTMEEVVRITGLSYDAVWWRINNGTLDSIPLPSATLTPEQVQKITGLRDLGVSYFMQHEWVGPYQQGKARSNRRIPLTSLRTFMGTEDYRKAKTRVQKYREH